MFELYFSDLTPEAQERFLAFYRVYDETEYNWDLFPIATFEVPEEVDFEGDVEDEQVSLFDLENIPVIQVSEDDVIEEEE